VVPVSIVLTQQLLVDLQQGTNTPTTVSNDASKTRRCLCKPQAAGICKGPRCWAQRTMGGGWLTFVIPYIVAGRMIVSSGVL
jgi:hypothetical protein